jgi:type II secretory pathway component PulM
MIEKLTAFWMERIARERAIIAVASFLAAFAIAYAYAWLPVVRERDRLLARVPELRAQAQAMERDARELQELKATTTPSVELRAVIQQAATASGLASASIAIVHQDSARMRTIIASARPEHAFAWLARVQSAAGVRLESIRVTSLEESGVVRTETMLAATR